ncbi:hypothetical protein BYT27DRAFT_7180614 [Phlegmacium glaucopus]|nr:hypothetical protein BYT27DRAFT_7180614 [Phlegmacium glaucopus]
MASFNLTVEDSSPLITYSPAGSWIDTPADDVLATSYSGGSFHTTTTQGANATINFNGTGMWIFGGQRPNYGTFSFIVDEEFVTTGTAESTVPSTQQLLCAVSGLTNGPHTAVFSNTNGQPVDVDSIVFESQVGGPGSAVAFETFDDSDAAIAYLPAPSAWQIRTAPTFFNDTLRSSQTPGASAIRSFSGEAVAIYGTVSPNHANVRVAIDGQSLILPGGSGGQVSAVRPQVLLYYQNNLVPGQHTLVLSGDSTPPAGPSIDLDFIRAFAGTSSATMPISVTTSNKSLSTGTMISAIVGGVIGFLLLVALLALGFLMHRRRRRKDRLVEDSMVPVSPDLPMQSDPKALEAGFSHDSAKLENMVFPLPPPTKAVAVTQRPATPSSVSDSSSGSHSRHGSVMSSTSTTPLVTSVPVLLPPQPKIARKPVPTSVGLVKKDVRFEPVVEFIDAHTPSRPNTRPPTMDFMGLSPEYSSFP